MPRGAWLSSTGNSHHGGWSSPAGPPARSRACLKSIVNQNFYDFELIIVDGGSKDNSINIIKSYEEKISWWVSEPDTGQSEAFNKGFREASGQYFFWVNADDILLPNSLTKAYELIKKKNAKWLAANTIFFDENKIIKKCTVGPKWNKFLIKYGPIYVYGPTSIFHRDLFFTVGGFG